MTATEVTRMALHFVFKSDIKSACITQNTGYDTADNIQSYCDSDWNNGESTFSARTVPNLATCGSPKY